MCQTCVCEEFRIISGKIIDHVSSTSFYSGLIHFLESAESRKMWHANAVAFIVFFFCYNTLRVTNRQEREKDSSYNFDKWFSWKIERACPTASATLSCESGRLPSFFGSTRKNEKWNEIKGDVGNKKKKKTKKQRKYCRRFVHSWFIFVELNKQKHFYNMQQ